MESNDLLKFVNQIFAKKGITPVKNLAADFADGCKYISLSNMCNNFTTICTIFIYINWKRSCISPFISNH